MSSGEVVKHIHELFKRGYNVNVRLVVYHVANLRVKFSFIWQSVIRLCTKCLHVILGPK